MGAPRPPMEYLAKYSQESLESIELARLARAANLRKEFQQLVDEWVAAEADARFARALLEWRRARASSHVEPVSVLDAREMKQPLPRGRFSTRRPAPIGILLRRRIISSTHRN